MLSVLFGKSDGNCREVLCYVAGTVPFGLLVEDQCCLLGSDDCPEDNSVILEGIKESYVLGFGHRADDPCAYCGVAVVLDNLGLDYFLAVFVDHGVNIGNCIFNLINGVVNVLVELLNSGIVIIFGRK